MGKPIIGIVGMGEMGMRFARLIAESPRAELLAVADPNACAAEEAVTRWGVRYYADVKTLVAAEPTVDALVVATPETAHVAPALVGAAAGKHLFVEKPLAINCEGCREIVSASKEAGTTLLVGHTLRFDPRYSAARAAMREGRIGEIVHTYSRRNITGRVLRRQGDAVSLALYLGVHDIDFILWAIDARVVRVTARGRRGLLVRQGLDLDDTIFSLIEFDNGVISCIENSWWVPEDAPGRIHAHQFEAIGTDGDIHLMPQQNGFVIRGPGSCEYPNTHFDGESAGRAIGAYRDEMEHFFDCIAGASKPLASGEDALRAVAVVEAIHRSLASGSTEAVSI